MVEPSLAMRDEDFAGLAVFVEADGDVALVAGDVELVRDGVAGVGQTAAQRALDDALDDFLDDVGVGGGEVVGRVLSAEC